MALPPIFLFLEIIEYQFYAIINHKHGITPEEATTAFADRFSIAINDPLHSDNEDRLILIGRSRTSKTLIVIHTEYRENIRIISARKATKKEQRFYEEY